MRAGDRVHAQLRGEIVTGVLTPGAELGEVEQAARLGVSRTPVREALRRLAADGLAVPGRGRTLVVAGLRADDVTHLFELREALETQATRLAAMRGRPEDFRRLADGFAGFAEPSSVGDRAAYYALVDELDEAVDHAMASPHLRRALASLRPHVARARRLSQDDAGRLVRAAEEHRAIATAVAERDPVLAAQVTAVHLRASLAAALAALAATPTTDHAPVPAGAAR